MDSLQHYRAAIGLFRHPPSHRSQTKMEEPFGSRRKLNTGGFFFGLGTLCLWATATWICIQMTARISTTRKVSILVPPMPDTAPRTNFSSEADDSKMTPLSLMTLVTFVTLTPVDQLSTRVSTFIHDGVTTAVMSPFQQMINMSGNPLTAEVSLERENSAWDLPLQSGEPSRCALVLWGAYLTMCRVRLLLASDVELNPGPDDVTGRPPTGPPEENDTTGPNFSANSQLLRDLLRDSSAETAHARRPQQEPKEDSMTATSVFTRLDSPTTDASFVTGAKVTSTQTINNAGGSPNLLPPSQLGNTTTFHETLLYSRLRIITLSQPLWLILTTSSVLKIAWEHSCSGSPVQ